MDSTNLKWVPWGGSLPPYAVSIKNSYCGGRIDYVCKSGFEAGFYTSDKGSYCYFPFQGREDRVSEFEILVNEGNLENLVWKAASHGSVPQNSVPTCAGYDKYVGRNEYGLGKVHVSHKCLYLPREKKEHSYSNYEVLTYETEILRQEISNVVYDKKGKTVKCPPETMNKSSITNKQGREVVVTVTLENSHQREKRWDLISGYKLGVITNITTGIPKLASGSVEVSAATTRQFSHGTTVTDSALYCTAVDVTVQPNSLCVVRMVGYKYKADIPFTALLTRTYRSGVKKSVPISGTYRGVNIEEVKTVVD